MLNLTYITSSSYSGSTLFTFLLNQHPDIFTIGELEGWNYEDNEDYRCSCGDSLTTCRFFSSLAAAYELNNISYNPRNFGTRFEATSNERVNRYLTQGIPFLTSSLIEKIRDAAVWHVPPFSRRLHRSALCNEIFIRHACQYSKAKMFVDATKSPFRLRHLKRLDLFDIKIIYLIRDLRGQVLSTLNKKPLSADIATRLWIRDQINILRVLNEFPGYLQIFYEDLCNDVQNTLDKVYRFIGLKPLDFSGNFKAGEHHILGNSMRIRSSSDIRPDTKWRTHLAPKDLKAIESTALGYRNRHPDTAVSGIINHYFDS